MSGVLKSGRHGKEKTIRMSESGHQTRLAQEWDEIPQSKVSAYIRYRNKRLANHRCEQ